MLPDKSETVVLKVNNVSRVDSTPEIFCIN